jgi:hypothetical protein
MAPQKATKVSSSTKKADHPSVMYPISCLALSPLFSHTSAPFFLVWRYDSRWVIVRLGGAGTRFKVANALIYRLAAIVALKDRKGSSRPALKKYILANYKITPGSHFDTQIAAGIKRG